MTKTQNGFIEDMYIEHEHTYSDDEDIPIKNVPNVESWAITLQEIYNNEALRLDASHYDPELASILHELQGCKYELKTLSKLADVYLPGPFARIWADEEAYGYPYVNATDLMSLVGIGTLSGNPRYLSKATKVDINKLIIHEGVLLLTCSGTLGRIFYVTKRLNGWAATHDLIRIIPKKSIPVGYLHAYLSSPMAQKQILGHTHGGQIDHITHHQVKTISVPILPKSEMEEIHFRTMDAIQTRERSISDLERISSEIQYRIKS